MKKEGFYIKKQIVPRRQDLNRSQNMLYYKTGKAFRNIDNNIIYPPVTNTNNTPNNKINNQILPQNSPFQNGQNYIDVNNMKNQNLMIQRYNMNDLKYNEESKLNIDNNMIASKGLFKNYVYNNNIGYNDNINQRQNPYTGNPNNIRLVYTPVNYINRLPLNNNIINPGLNQPIMPKRNIVPVLQMPRPVNPIRKNLIIDDFNTPNKNIIKNDNNNQQRYSTIQAESKYELENVNYPPIWTERKRNNYIIDEDSPENNGYCSKNNGGIISNNNKDLSTPVKVKNDITDIYDQYQASNLEDNYQQFSSNDINTPINELILEQQQIINDNEQIEEKTKINPLNQPIQNYDELINDNLYISPNITPIKTPTSNQDIQFNNNPPNEIYDNLSQNIPQVSKNLFGQKISIKSFSHLSRAGSEEDGFPKTNQDSFVVLPKVNNIKDFSIFSILDGHGPKGHLVSKFVSQNLIKNIINNPTIKSLQNSESIYLTLKQNNYQIIKQSFISTDLSLKNCNFDVKESGTTCLLIIILNSHLICANVGDSRAIAVFDENNDPNLSKIKAVPLSKDYKLDIPEERNRILMSGGKVDQLKDSMGVGQGPLRVFKPGEIYPGLAMSRSIGDTLAKSLGVIAEPGIFEYNLNEKTKFIVLGSDGIWEFLDNEEVKNIGKSFYLNCDSSDLCEELYNSALIKWKCNDEIVDDITVIVIYF